MTDDCSICLEEISARNTGLTELTCGHKYHPRCIGKWLIKNPSCPECRNKTVDSETPEKLGDTYSSVYDSINYINHTFISRMASAVVRANPNVSDTLFEDQLEPVAEPVGESLLQQNIDFPQGDVELVAQQSDVSLNVALVALQRHNGDIVNAIMSLDPPEQQTMSDLTQYDRDVYYEYSHPDSLF